MILRFLLISLSAFSAPSPFLEEVDMVDYLECGRAHKLEYLSERGLVVGLSFTSKEIDEAASKKGGFMGMTLYACPKGEWIWFNGENQMMLSHFGIKKDYLAEKCKGAEEVFIKEVWEKKKKPEEKFAIRVNCKAIHRLLK